MNFLQKAKWGYIGISLGAILLGVCLVVWPELSARTLCYVLGATTIVLGAVELIIFFVQSRKGLTYSLNLAIGVLLTVFGIMLLIKPDNILTIFPIIAGVVIVVDSVVKFQSAFDMRIMGINLWWITLICAVSSAVLGILMIFNPFEMTQILMIFVGISLIVDGIQNIYTVIYFSIAAKKIKKAIDTDITIIEE